MRLINRNVFVDTNVFEEHNFFHGTNIQSLFYYSRIGIINLFLTEISRMELIDRMNKNLLGINNDFNLLVNKINKTRILKNIPRYASIEKSPIIIQDCLDELTTKFATVIKANNIQIIKGSSLDVDNVFANHFNSKAPFSNKNEKHFEFKDAFILQSIETWCERNRKKMIFITNDSDFNGYQSKRIIFRKDLVGFLEKITFYYDTVRERSIIPVVKDALDVNKQAIKDLIIEKLDQLVMIDVDFDKLTNFKSSINLLDYNITSIRSNFAEVNYNFELIYNYIVYPTLNDIKRSAFEDTLKPISFSDKIALTSDLEVYFNRTNHVKLKWINSNQKIRIVNKKTK